MEEDAGKSLHDDDDGRPATTTGVDFNRSGVPLIEIVTEPDLDSAEAAAACFSRIRDLLVAVGVTDGNMEEGSLRCDANVSLRSSADAPLGVQDRDQEHQLVPLRAARGGVRDRAAGRHRCRAVGAIEQETRLWDSAAGRTVSMRGKEEAHDYRYLPEPDLPPLRVDASLARAPAGVDARAAGPDA